jgi:hypothetical protein
MLFHSIVISIAILHQVARKVRGISGGAGQARGRREALLLDGLFLRVANQTKRKVQKKKRMKMMRKNKKK